VRPPFEETKEEARMARERKGTSLQRE